MSVDSSGLLRMLGGAKVPGAGANGVGTSGTDVPASRGQQSAPLTSAGFAELLSRARSGKVQSGEPVTIDERLGINLTSEQLHRLGAAVDVAKAQGFNKAVVLIDGQALVVDVETRRINGVLEPGKVASAAVDGVVRAAAEGQEPDTASAGTQIEKLVWLAGLRGPTATRQHGV